MSDENEVIEEVTEEVIDQPETEQDSEEVVEESQDSEEISEDSEEETEVQAETEEELAEELQEAADAGASKEELTNMVRQYTLKVNNKEYVRELDLNDEEAVKRALQMEIAGRQAMQSKAELEKAYSSDIERLKSDPFGVLAELGLDPIELSSKQLEKFLEEKKKSPEQVERERVEREIAEMKAENERLKKEKEDQERQAAISQAEKEIEGDIISALEGDTDLVASPEVINMVVDNMLWAMSNGYEDVTAKDVLPTVKNELQKKYRSYAKSMKSTTALKSLLGDDILNNLKEERIQKVKSQVNNINNVKSTTKKVEKKDEAPKRKLSLSDFMQGR